MSAQPRPDRRWGVFETVLVLDGEAVEIEAHLARLESSLRALFPDRAPSAALADAIHAEAAGVARGGLRVTVVPSAGAGFDIAVEEAELEAQRVLPPAPLDVHAHTLVVRGGLGRHKWADRRLLDEAQAGLAADAVPLIFDWDDTLLEASRANVFVALGSALLTPPTDGRILPGTTRARVLAVAAETELEVREAALRRADLTGADEVFLTGSLRGAERVRTLDGVALNSKGEAASRLHAALRRAWAGAGLDRVPRR